MDRRETIAAAIELLRRRYAWLDREIAGTARSVWEVAEAELRWTVVLGEVLEPDVDVELLGEVIVVRAETGARPGVLQALLPAPDPFDGTHPLIRFRAGVLEVRLRRRGAGA